MDENNKSQTLSRMLEEQITSFDKRRKRDKDKAFWARMIQAFSSASITVLLGLNVSKLGGSEYLQDWLKAVALMISAAATLFTTWDAFFDHRELWIRYAAAASTLRSLRSELQYITSMGSASTEEDIDRLFRKFQETLEKVNSSWQQLRASSLPSRSQDNVIKPKGPTEV